MLTVVIGLVCFAVAFVSGGLLSKVYFTTRGAPDAVGRNKLHALLQTQQVSYRKRMQAQNNVILRHEKTRDQIRDKLTSIERKHAKRGQLLNAAQAELERKQQENQDLQQQLSKKSRCIADLNTSKSIPSSMEKELSMLRIERDELAARFVHMETEQAQEAATREANRDEDKIARMRADMGELRETLATRDRRVHDLDLQVRDNAEQVRQLQAKLDNWKQRVTPLTRKLKQQKEVIQKFCRNSGAEQQAGAPGNNRSGDNLPDDDLKAIRGIGPALERRLQRNGIRRYQHLAEMTPQDLTDIAQQLAIAPNLAERDEWIEQARNLQAQEELCETA